MPRKIPAQPAACRRVGASWLVTAPTARNITALATSATPKYAAAPTPICTLDDRPTTAVISVARTHNTLTPTRRPTSAWETALRRVAAPLRRSSQRPVSSSPRSSRVLVRSPHTAPTTMRVIETMNAVKPAKVCSCGAGPNKALAAWFDPNEAAK